MIRIITTFYIFILLITSCNSKADPEISNKNVVVSPLTKLKYCELIENPAKYDGQTVILKGVFMLQFEASHFVSFSCEPKIAAVASFDAPPCSDKSEIVPWDWSSAMTNRAHGVIIKGWLENKIQQGHSTGELSKYYKFHIDCIEKIQKLGSMDTINKGEAEAVKKRIDDFEKS